MKKGKPQSAAQSDKSFLGRVTYLFVHKPTCIALACTLIYIVIAIQSITQPGLQYDEALFINAARGGLDQSFITYTWHGIPVMLMNYIGAVKSYIWAPIFFLFGVNIETIRIPAILLAGVGMMIQYLWIKKLAKNATVPLLVTVFTILDASFYSHTRTDLGPYAIAFLMQSVLLLALLQFLEKPHPRLILVSVVASLLGVFNKLNFLWTVNAYLLAASLAYFPMIRKVFKDKQLTFQLVGEVGSVYLLFLAIYTKFNNYIPYSLHDLTLDLPVKLHVISRLIEGTFIPHYYMMYPLDVRFSTWFVLFIIVLVLLTLPLVWQSKKYRQSTVFSLSIIVMIFAQMFMTVHATSTWHAISAFPFYWIVVANSALAVRERFGSSILRHTGVAAISLVCLYLGYISMQMFRNFATITTSSAIWSPAIYEVSAITKEHDGLVLSTDWGTHSQLLAFDTKRNKYFELWVALSNDGLGPELEQYVVDMYMKPGTLFISKTDTAILFPQTKKSLMDLANKYNVQLKLEATIPPTNGIYEIYSFGGPIQQNQVIK